MLQPDGNTLVRIDPSLIRPMAQGQPRTHFSERDLRELQESIRVSEQRQPAIVCPLSAEEQASDPHHREYELLAGERRWRSVLRLKIPLLCRVLPRQDDADTLLESILENESRVDLSPYEKAHAYSRLQRLYKCSEAELARKIGKHVVLVNDALRLSRLDPVVLALIHPSLPNQKRLRIATALKLEGYPPEEQRRLAPRLIGVPWRKAEAIIKHGAEATARPLSQERTPPDILRKLRIYSERAATDTDRFLDWREHDLVEQVAKTPPEQINEVIESLELAIGNLSGMLGRLRKAQDRKTSAVAEPKRPTILAVARPLEA